MHTQDRIVLDQASIALGSQIFFENFSWRLKPGEHWVISGNAGTGKSFLAEALAQKHRLISGSRTYPFLGDNPSFDERQAAIQMISFMDTGRLFRSVNAVHYYQQRYNAFDSDGHLTVRQYLEHGGFDIRKHEGLLQSIGIFDLLELERIKLSSGQTRKMLLCKVMLKEPKILILDNPYIGLDTGSRQFLNELLDNLVETQDISLVLAGHYRDLPKSINHRLHIYPNKKIEAGPLKNFLKKKDNPSINEEALTQIKKKYQESEQAETFDSIIRFEEVNIQYKDKQILKDLNWEVKAGEKWRIIGPNGSGKSTLLSLIYADNPQAYANSIFLFDQKVGSGQSIWDVKKRIGFTSPELHAYFDRDISAWELVLTGMTDTFYLKTKAQEKDKELARLLFQYFELESIIDQSFERLSTGTQRLLLLIRALVKAAPVLLLDEPFQGLDEISIYRSRYLLDKVLSERHTLLFISHFQEEAPDCVDLELGL
ncbi:MAG: ATP-binding cassette domain-containing protein [Bacteroidia bacterium]|nr:ATP-binding cassette domain-containing protein [Bacteroidia bacterium]